MSFLDVLLAFLAFYPVVTGAAWMVGGVLFRILEERSALATPPGGWPGVTVLVPAYNEEQVIARCVQALRGVDHPDLEILILNDGSADRTVDVATTRGWPPRTSNSPGGSWRPDI
ncbi:glycosyltransferase [Streptomyces luteolus]|uniref:Glycosyltransferase n=1 Tax=Streptomyces luteolus TaxID=3043615 RepID=A0ABT6SZU5_9ACTN|nr:glycosyltransferase [Streptomyces sp. B-S-A12]MDI3420715.1 glycosyltransferase [Streptomyces sp. B-S-A12]